MLQLLRRFEHEQREHRSHAQNPGRSPGKQKDPGFTPAGRPRAREEPQPCLKAAPAPAGPELPETEPSLQTAPLLRLSPTHRWYRLTYLSGVTEGASTFSLFHPLKIFITNKRHSFSCRL